MNSRPWCLWPFPVRIPMLCTCLVVLTVLWAHGDDVAGKNRKGMRFFEQGSYEEALTAFRDAELESPESPQVHFNIGDVLYRQKKYEEAQEEYQKAVSTEDAQIQSQAYYNIGNALYRTNKLVEAIDYYKRCLEINPDDVDAKFNLEFVRKKLKENSQQQQQQQQQPQQDQSQQEQGQQQQEQDQQQQQGQEEQENQRAERQHGEQQQQKQAEEGTGQQAEKKEGEMSKAEAQRILDALKNDEENAQKEMRRMRSSGERHAEKDW